MDPLSVTASIATLIHLTVKLGSVCQQYYFGVKEARKDIQRVIDEMASLSDVLQTLKGIVDSSSGASLAISHSLNGPDGPLQQCYSEMRMIGEKLDASDGKWRSMKKSFAWPFKEKDVTKIVTVIERQKSTLELGLTVDNTAMAIATKDGLQELRDAIIEANLDSKRQRILNWLAGTDPSKNHNAAREKHEPTTGDWLTRGSTLEGWRTAPNSLLWLHGKAGSGKTIISSTVVQYIQASCGQDPTSAMAYFYFDFSDSTKQNARSMLSSIIVQLCRQTCITPGSLHELYRRCLDGDHSPTMDSLEGILSETLDAFKHVYLVLDALDECPKLDGNRERVLKVIRRILGRCNEQVHILATSRREADIEKVMTPLLTECTGSSICVQSAVNEDIKLYTSSHLESWKFSSWPNNIKQEVESVLTAQADGMFRWVACQLDLLQDLSQPSTIRKALRSLPKTLDATYDRMLQSISDDCQDQAIAALKWLTFSARPLSVTELADAVVVNHLNDPPFDPDDRLFDPLRILDFLPGLVVVSSVGDGGEDKQQIRLAHFSVKEYLLSPRIRVSPASAFSMIEIEAHTFIAETCLAYQLQVSNSEFSMIEIEAHTFIAETCLAYHLQGSNSATSLVRLLQKFPLLPYAALYWVQHATMTDSRSWNASVSQLCIELLRSRGSFINWVRISRGPMFFTIKPRPETESRYIATKLYYAARHDLLPAVDWLLGNGADVNAQDEINGTALHVASGNGHVAVVERLLKDGADVNAHLGYFNNALQAASGKGHEALTERLLRDEAHVNAQGGIHETALHVASGNGHLAVVERLLKSGADVNARGGIRGTPLQVASGRGHMAVVEQLLKGGADVNAQGGFYDNALQAASGNGHVAVVERLLRNGADVNAQGGHCGNALVAASCYGNEAVVERLLKGGADVHASGRGYGNALEAASARGHDAIVERLREYSTRAGRRRDST